MKMQITPEIRQNHRRLSGTSERFLDFAAQNPDALERSSFKDILAMSAGLARVQPWPTFIDRNTAAEVKAAAVDTLQLLRRIPGGLFDRDLEKIARYYGVPTPLVHRLLDGADDPHLHRLIGRGDFMFSRNGGIKCIEYNVNTNLGGLQNSYWGPMYLRVPVIRRFLSENNIRPAHENIFSHLFQHLVDQGLKTSNGGEGEINIAIVDAEDGESVGEEMTPYLGQLYTQALYLKDRRLTGQLISAGYSQFNVADSSLYFNGKRVHGVLEMCNGFVPADILDCQKSGNLFLVNGAVAWLLSTKLNLALLSEHRDSSLFTPREREILRRHIPWTHSVREGDATYNGESAPLREILMTHRETLVMKPVMGSGGRGVHIGRNTPEPRWRELVNTALKDENRPVVADTPPDSQQQWNAMVDGALTANRWLVQEEVRSDTYLYQSGDRGCAPHHAVWGIFVFGSGSPGGWLRILPEDNAGGIINSHQGAQGSTILETAD